MRYEPSYGTYIHFTSAECELIGKYSRTPTAINGLVEEAEFLELRSKIERLAQLADTCWQFDAIPMKPFYNEYRTRAARTPAEFLCGITPKTPPGDGYSYPERYQPNKAYLPQITFGLDEGGARFGFALGEKKPSTEESDADRATYQTLKRRFASMTRGTQTYLQLSLSEDWRLQSDVKTRVSSDFPDLDSWLKYITAPNTKGGSILFYVTPQQLDSLGSLIVELYINAVYLFRPVFRDLYGLFEEGDGELD